ncbi:MAG: phosphate/phosphite/phosphonate ABC transporter substrate-binding protein [Bdellovibrio sp.]
MFSSVFMLTHCTPKNGAVSVEPQYLKSATVEKPLVRFAVHPLHNPELLNDVFGPLISYLNENIKEVHFQLEASVNYTAYEEKLKRREVEFALPNPYQTILATQHGYKIFAKMGDDQNFRGIILVRKDSGIKSILDLKGKTISYPAPTALAATMMPQYYLFVHGLKVRTETKSHYVGSQESSIMNVFLKTSQAGATWPPPWKTFVLKHPEFAKELEVKWQTQTLPNNGLVYRDDVSPELVAKVKKIILELEKSAQGKKILVGMGLSKFESADEKTYVPVKKFLKEFSKKVRPPEEE